MATELAVEAAAEAMNVPLETGGPSETRLSLEFRRRIAQRALDAAAHAEWPPIANPRHDSIGMPKRHWRAQRLTAEIMNTLRRYISDDRERDHMRDAYRDLFDLLFTKGAEVITDEDRRAAGLPPRNEYGLTSAEMVAMEARRLELMLAPVLPVHKVEGV